MIQKIGVYWSFYWKYYNHDKNTRQKNEEQHKIKELSEKVKHHGSSENVILRWLVLNPLLLSKMEIHLTIYDNRIFNLWTSKPFFEIKHSLLVSLFDKVSKPRLSRFTR